MIPVALVLLPCVAAIVVAALPNTARNATAWLAGLTALVGCALLGVAAPAVFGGEILRVSLPWFADVAFGFRMDGLAWAFALVIFGIGALVVLYARYYLSAEDPPARFYAFLLAFMGAMLGIVLADNLILMVVFWELTSVSSFLLIGFWNQRADARQGARMALTVTGMGGLCLLGGVILLGQIVGSYSLDVVLGAGEQVRADPRYPLTLVLILLGAFTKSAQFPFHFWLPHAMAAPTPVSAYLHSATMVKAGVFLLARLYPTLGGSDLWFYVVGGTGLVTMIFGAAVAIFQQDLKGLLAYSTISHLGLITLLFGLNSPLAVVAGLFHILNHATFKASLFMAAGIIDHETGSRDMRQLNGLWQFMPITGNVGDGRFGCDGRRAAAERLPVQGNVLRRDDRPRCVAPDRMAGAGRRDDRGGAGRGVQHALHPRRVLQRTAGRAHADAARAAALAARAGGDPGRRVRRRGRCPQLDHRAGAGGDGERHAGHAAGIQPGALARIQCSAADERASRCPWASPCTSGCSGTSTCIR